MMTSSGPRQDFGYSRTVSYSNSKHLSVIYQKYGSVNKKVMPFCLANVALTLGLILLLEYDIDLTISEFGHEFMSVLVAFLVINKLSFTLSLYYELQGYLSQMNRSLIDLTQLSCSFTAGYSQEAYQDWRFNVTLHASTLLKATVLVILKGGTTKAWEIPELKGKPLVLYLDEPLYGRGVVSEEYLHVAATKRRKKIPKELYIWGLHLPSDKNLRTPIRLAQRLRDAIVSRGQLPQDPIDTIREQTLLNCVKEFSDGYHGVRKYLTCPLPLPLVQLGRVFVTFYTFTMPFALLSPDLNLQYPQLTIIIFLMTYGFMGIELLFCELDDPFNEDPNDLPLTEESRAAGEDIFLNLFHVDGSKAIERLNQQFANGMIESSPNNHGHIAKETDPLV